MKIIVAGCGKVGTTIVEQLSEEGHEISVIDRNADVVNNVAGSYDVLGVVGNSASYSVQKEAGVENADILIAVTDSDEINMLCCLIAKRIGVRHTVARIRNPEYSQNGDGIDIDACTNVILTNSSLDCGDDGICIKSGKDGDGRRHATPCQNLIIDGCTVFHGHGGFVVGSEMSGGVRNIMVSNCRFLGTDVGLRFKSKRGRGGVVEGIWIDNIYMTDIVTDALLFDLFYGGKSAVEALEDGVQQAPGSFPVDETTPAFRDIHISNVVCNGAARAMYFNGLPEMPVKGISISNCSFSSRKGIEIHCSEDVTIDNVKVVTITL